jgi:hypothetical protein
MFSQATLSGLKIMDLPDNPSPAQAMVSDIDAAALLQEHQS